jgi:general secretion pathway protein F
MFPPLYVGIVRAAEGTSDLPRSLARYIDYQQRIDSVRNKIVSSAIYPLILLVVGGGVTFFLVGYVVPRFAEVYQGAGRSLPWLSRLLLEWGQFASMHAQALALAVLAGLSASAIAARRFFSTGGTAKLLARLPGIGERARIYELSRLYLTMGMLLEGGIPIVPAMQTVEGIVSPGLRDSLRSAAGAVESGTPLSNAFEAQGLATPISLRMLRVGERSGELGQMLTQSATFYDGEIGRWIDRFTRTFEPLLMAAIGLVVGTIVVLLYMPIFDLAGSLS